MRQLRVRVPLASADAAVGLLWSAGVDGIEELDGPPGEAELGAGVDGVTGADLEWLVEQIEALPGASAELVDLIGAAQRWRAEWEAHARAAVILDALVVRPPWVGSPHPELAEIVIDPGDAWGHGGHVTTRLALELLVVGPVPPGPRVLDVGCGSGVLGVAAARLGADCVVGVDVDPAALVATDVNAVANDVAVVIAPTIEDAGSGRFDLVIANIEAAVLIDLAEHLVSALAAGGRLILSGFLEARAHEVVAAMIAAGPARGGPLVEAARRVIDGWAAVELA